MLVEPASLRWLAGRKTEARDGVTWAAGLERWSALTTVVRDGGTGLSKRIELVRARRREQQGGRVGGRPGHLPHLRERGPSLTRDLGRSEPRPGAGRGRRQRGRQGQSHSGHGAPLRRLWAAAEAAFRRAEVAEVAWGRARSALALFPPEGRPNSRPRAEAVVQAAMAELVGTAWAKTRRLLSCPESFTLLDQAARRLADLELGEEVLSALLDLEGLRRQPWRFQGATPAAATARGLALARVVQWEKTSPGWREQAAVHRVLRGGWWASSLAGASTAWRGCSSRGTAR